jgi:hypothetical protein
MQVPHWPDAVALPVVARLVVGVVDEDLEAVVVAAP